MRTPTRDITRTHIDMHAHNTYHDTRDEIHHTSAYIYTIHSPPIAQYTHIISQAREHFDSLPKRLPVTHKFASVRGAASHGTIGRRPDMEDDEIIVDQLLGSPYQ